jgi:hypothetical protein
LEPPSSNAACCATLSENLPSLSRHSFRVLMIEVGGRNRDSANEDLAAADGISLMYFNQPDSVSRLKTRHQRASINGQVCSFTSNSGYTLCGRCRGELAYIWRPLYSHARNIWRTLRSSLRNFVDTFLRCRLCVPKIWHVRCHESRSDASRSRSLCCRRRRSERCSQFWTRDGARKL